MPGPIPLEQDPGSVVYAYVSRLIRKIWSAAVANGFDPIEAESAANYAFVSAVDTYDQERGPFPQWVAFKVRNEIRMLARRRRYKRLPLTDMTDDDAFPVAAPAEPEAPDVTESLLAMSDDAAAWVSLVLNPPDSVQKEAVALGWGDETNTASTQAAGFRQAVFNYLVECGWSKRRTQAAYMEACASLSLNRRASS